MFLSPTNVQYSYSYWFVGRLLNENEDLKRQQKDMLAELEMFREQPQQQA